MICAHTRSGKEEFWLLANAFQPLTLESITRREILLRSKGKKNKKHKAAKKKVPDQVQVGRRERERNYTCPAEVIAVKAPRL